MDFQEGKGFQIRDYGILALAAFLCFLAVFHGGYPIGDDYKNQIIGFEAFREQINQGELYPRWLNNINHGFGGANLFFYPPLVYYVEYGIGLIYPAQTTSILCVSALLFLLLSGLTCRLWLSSFCSRRGALAGAILYMAAPYHLFVDMYERNNGAEFAVYVWVPLLFYLVQTPKNETSRLARSAKIGLVYAAFLLTHLPSAVFITPFAGLWGLGYRFIHHDEPRRGLGRLMVFESVFLVFSFALGLLVCGLYLVPALTLLDTVRSYVLWGGPFYDYKLWFIGHQNQCPGPYKAYCSLLFIVAAGAILPGVVCFSLFYERLETTQKRIFIFLFILSVLCLFLMTPFASFIWYFAVPLQKIQFPYRLMILMDLFCAAFAGFIFSRSQNQKAKMVNFAAQGGVLAVFAVISFFTARYVIQSWHPEMPFFEYRIEHRILTGEFMPKNEEMTVNINDFVEKTPPQPLWRTEGPEAKISLQSQAPRNLTFKIQAGEPTVFILRQFRFAGWQAFLTRENGEHTPIQIKAIEPYGQVSVSLPKGTYDLHFLIPLLWQEKVGAYMSIAGLILICGLFVLSILRHRTETQNEKTP